MQNEKSQQVIGRFFECLHTLKQENIIRGVSTITKRYEINRRNLFWLDNNRASDSFQVSWLTGLVNDYGVSPLWLLTGKGEMFTDKPEPIAFKNAKRKKA